VKENDTSRIKASYNFQGKLSVFGLRTHYVMFMYFLKNKIVCREEFL